MEETPEVEVLKRHTAHLMEHFDSVQIFVTRHAKQHTVGINYGDGNLYSRLALAREWVVRQDEYVKLDARRETEPQEDDEEDDEECPAP